MTPPLPVRILGTGSYLPARCVTSAELDARYGRAPGSSAARSGVEARHYADAEETSSAMAASALARALETSGLEAGALDWIVAASSVPEQPMPPNGVLVQRRLGLGESGIPCVDVSSSCLSFLSALEVAALAIAAGRYRCVGVVASEVASKGVDVSDVESSALFGDGAAAAVLGPSPAGSSESGTSPAIESLRFATFGCGADHCRIAAGGTRFNVVTPPAEERDYLFQMNGLAIFRLAAETLPAFLDGALSDAGCTRDDIDLVIPHQASRLGLRLLCERLGFPADKVVDILATRGNQVAASIPTALDEAVTSSRLERGMRALLVGTAAGLTLGAAVIRY